MGQVAQRGTTAAMEEPTFDPELHIKYWNRCLKSLLPTAYTSTDSSRMTLAFFILSALDLLGAGADTLSRHDIDAFKSWVSSCEHPNGGFCGSPNHKYPDKYYGEEDEFDIAPANLAATCFALLTLGFLGKSRAIKRISCLRWLKKLQRGNGSFGEFRGKEGNIEGGRDMRYCYLAVCVRWMLKGDSGPFGEGDEEYEDISVDKLVKHIRFGETYDGGIGESSRHESHAGYTYCAIASLSILNRLPASLQKHAPQTPKNVEFGLTNESGTIRWLLSRQLAYSELNNEFGNYGQPPLSKHMSNGSDNTLGDDDELPPLGNLTLHEPFSIGFNGRLNKPVDTCYCFWVCGSLEVLGKGDLVDKKSTRRFLLDHTQHRIGGFGKQPGEPPDIYHSYLALATLAMMKERGLKNLNPALSVSTDLENKIHNASLKYWT